MKFFDNKNFDANDFNQCVQRGMDLISNREEQAKEECITWNIDTKSCKWAIQQAIINRCCGKTMMSAVIEYVEKIEFIQDELTDLSE